MPDNFTLPEMTIAVDGVIRYLDRQPEPPRQEALPRLRDAYSDDPSTWHETDQLAVFNPRVLNQIQRGCVGHGGDTGWELAWLQSGQAMPEGGFSPTFLYAQINGGRDAGANIGDLIEALTTVGQVTARSFPESVYMLRGGQVSPTLAAEAAKYRADEMYAFSTFEELGTALSRGFAVAHSVQVGDAFMRLDDDGVVGVDAGAGNHCVCAGGFRKKNGVWQVHNQNSWSEQWGQRGRFFTTADHVRYLRYFGQPTYTGVAIKSVKPAPGGTLAPPAN